VAHVTINEYAYLMRLNLPRLTHFQLVEFNHNLPGYENIYKKVLRNTCVIKMATTTTLPAFDQLSIGDPHAPHEPLAQDSLPDYTPRNIHVSEPVEEREFEYKVEKKKGHTVASLKVLAPATYSKNIPTFVGTGPVKGSANLYLEEPDTITFVVVSVRA
jgi:hypothetical protein